MQYNTGRDSVGCVIPVDDPLAAKFQQITQEANGDVHALVDGYLRLDLFDGPLRSHEMFRRRLVEFCAMMEKQTPRDIIVALGSRSDAEEKL
jgi:fructuronate reductase